MNNAWGIEDAPELGRSPALPTRQFHFAVARELARALQQLGRG